MKDVIEDVDAWVERGEDVALATVVGVKRSAPRPPGSKMAGDMTADQTTSARTGSRDGGPLRVARPVPRRRR